MEGSEKTLIDAQKGVLLLILPKVKEQFYFIKNYEKNQNIGFIPGNTK